MMKIKNFLEYLIEEEAHITRRQSEKYRGIIEDQLPAVKEFLDRIFQSSATKFGNVNSDGTRMYFVNDEVMTPYELKGEFGSDTRTYGGEASKKAKRDKGKTLKYNKDQIVAFIKSEIAKDPNTKNSEVDFTNNNISITKFNKFINKDETKDIGITTYLKRIEKSVGPEIIQEYIDSFNGHPDRQGVNLAAMKTLIVISRDSDDLAGMSTGKGWSSCMNLQDGINRRFIAGDIVFGTLIALMIKESDLDCANPSGRVLLKPFFSELPKEKKSKKVK